MPPVSSRRHRFRVARRCRLRRVSCPLDQTRYRYCCRSHIIPAIAAALAIVCFIIMFVSACCALAGATVRYPGVEFGEQGAPDRDGDEALRRDYCEVSLSQGYANALADLCGSLRVTMDATNKISARANCVLVSSGLSISLLAFAKVLTFFSK